VVNKPAEAAPGVELEEVSPRENVESALRILIDAQKVSAAERAMDGGLFGGESRERDAFVRLLLRSSEHEFEIPGTGRRTQQVVFEPRLLLSESGEIQLTIAVSYDVILQTSQLVELSRSDRARLLRSDMPEPLMAGMPKPQSAWAGEWSDSVYLGARLRQINFDEPATMADALERHLNAVGAVIGESLPSEWFVYATIITSAGDCCRTRKCWERSHRADLNQVVARHSGSGVRLDPGTDFSIGEDESHYVNLAGSTHITLKGDPAEGIGQLQTVLLIEFGLLLYWRLRTLELRAEAFKLDERSLNRLYRDCIQLFIDLRHGDVKYGSAREISRHLVSELGGADIRATLEQTLELSAQAFSTRSAARDSGRALRLTFLATAITTVVAVPVIPQFLEAAKSLHGNSLSDFVLGPFRWAAEQGPWGTWIVIGAVLAVPLLQWLIMRVPLVRHLRIPRAYRRRGRTWSRSPLNIVFADNLEATDSTAREGTRR
jgi:hypothetical protein